MNTTKNIATCLGISLTCLMLVSQVAYAGVAGYAQFVTGSVQIVSAAGQTRTLQKGEAVNEGDTVVSAKAASVQIKMQDGGFVAMRPDTRLKFDSFKFNGKEDGSERSFFSLFKGGFRAVTGLIGRVNKTNYRITTAASTIGIRGTDHETFVVTPDSPLANGVPIGTYNKVNVGETSMTTDKGTVFVLPNQMGFAGGADQMPELRPLNTDIFTVADRPTKEAKGDKQEGKEEGKEVRENATVDNTAEEGAAPAAELASSTGEGGIDTNILQRITTTDGKDLTGSDTTHNPTYTALNGYGFEALGVDAAGAGVHPYAINLPGTSYLLDAGNNLVNVVGGVSGESIKFDDGVAKDTYVSTDGSVYFGRWQGGKYVDPITLTTVNMWNTNTSMPTSMQWVFAANLPSGYVQTLVGTTSYALTAATHPTDNLGNIGTLTAATLTADFTNQIVNASLALSFSTTDPVNISTQDKAFTVTTPNGIVISGNTIWGAGAVACSGSCQDTSYSADIWARFAGNTADKVALPYNIIGGTDVVQGVALVSTTTPPAVGTFAAYTPSNIAIEVASPFGMGNGNYGNYLVAPADITYTPTGSNNLSSFIDRQLDGSGETNSYSEIGGITPVTGVATSGTTGIQFGRWTSVTALQNSYTAPLRGTNWGVPTTWMYGPEGYLDVGITAPPGAGPAGQMYGTFTYNLDNSTAPYDKQSGQRGVLNSASISVDFTTSLVSANLALTVGGQAWWASASNLSLGGSQFFAGSSLGGTNNNLTISTGVGTPTVCPTCFGNLDGAFTGQNYAGAILSYNLGDNANAGGDVSGQAAFARTGPTIINGTAAPTGMYMVADQSGNIQMADTISTDVNGVLTGYSSGSPVNPAGYYSTTVTCTTCTSVAATNAATTGIYLGTWDAGSYSQTYGGSIGSASPHLIFGPEAGPLFLANALVGTKSFNFDGGMVTNFNGVAGTVLGTTTLTVDFTRQVMGINIDLLVPDTQATPVSHTWNATTLPGNEAIINGGKGIGGAAFQASSYNGTGPGLLTVTVDGTMSGNGNVSGQLTGVGLNGAILSYDLNAIVVGAASPTFEQVNGVAALVGATSDIATPHREVMMSLTDPTSIIKLPVLGFYADDPTRMLTDVAGNLTRFDMSTINNGGKNDSSNTVAVNTTTPPTLANAGNDPLTGISWGRWDGGSVDVTNRATGAVTTHALAGSLHWIAGPTETAAVTLPVSGSYTYTNAGGTAPTDNLGAVGTLNSATLSANFTAQTVNVGVDVTVSGSNLVAAASNVPIIQRTAFYADSQMPLTSATHLAVTCAGTCGTSTQGVILGGFGGAGATGAMMTYGLQNISAAGTQVISGVTAFHR